MLCFILEYPLKSIFIIYKTSIELLLTARILSMIVLMLNISCLIPMPSLKPDWKSEISLSNFSLFLIMMRMLCNAFHCFALLCNALQGFARLCNALQIPGQMHFYNALQGFAMLCNAFLCFPMLCNC